MKESAMGLIDAWKGYGIEGKTADDPRARVKRLFLRRRGMDLHVQRELAIQ